MQPVTSECIRFDILRGRLPEVHCSRLAVGASVDHETSSANATGLGPGDVDGEDSCNGGVHGIATAIQDTETNL
jgi:hypothetical protein